MDRNRPVAARCPGKPRIRILQAKETAVATPHCTGKKPSVAHTGPNNVQVPRPGTGPAGPLGDWASI